MIYRTPNGKNYGANRYGENLPVIRPFIEKDVEDRQAGKPYFVPIVRYNEGTAFNVEIRYLSSENQQGRNEQKPNSLLQKLWPPFGNNHSLHAHLAGLAHSIAQKKRKKGKE